MESRYQNYECILVCNGPYKNIKTDQSLDSRFTIVYGQEGLGVAEARNLGAKLAKGEILFFTDPDVCIKKETLEKVIQIFNDKPVQAIIGSYTWESPHSNFTSRYKNLQNYYFHQNEKNYSKTFWTACGAIYKNVFLEVRGFKRYFYKPSVEDIELGYRLNRAGYKIWIDSSLKVTHYKRWSLASLIKGDFLFRAIPWSLVLFEYGFKRNELNLAWTQKASVLLSFLLIFTFVYSPVISFCALMTICFLNRDFIKLCNRTYGIKFSCQSLMLLSTHFFYSGVGFIVALFLYKIGLKEYYFSWQKPTYSKQNLGFRSSTRTLGLK